MATNFLQPGNVLTLTAPAGGVTSGVGYVIGSIFVIALADAIAGAPFEGQRQGTFSLPKHADVAGFDFAEGEAVFWDDTNKRLDKTGATFYPVGYVADAAATADTTCELVLAGVPTAVVGV
jgi:predicted RecA/RadA family phage recombinase